MRFYHLAFEGHVRPLGYGGIGRSSLGQFADRVRTIDATDAVGRSHALGDYLTSTNRVGQALEQIVLLPGPDPGDASLAAGDAADAAVRN
jgi:hypothetical protein